jgi:hypothetical protein
LGEWPKIIARLVQDAVIPGREAAGRANPESCNGHVWCEIPGSLAAIAACAAQ